MQVKKQQLELDMEQQADWFQIGKRVHQGCILSPCLLNLYTEYIMRKAGLDEAEVGIKIAGRNISNLRYADDTNFMAECEEELNSLLVKVKEEGEKLTQNSTWVAWMASSHHSMANRWENNGKSDKTFFSWAPKSLQMMTAALKLRDSCSLEEKL